LHRVQVVSDLNIKGVTPNLISHLLCYQVFKELEAESGINLAASTDLTGNKASGGNWLMETDGVNVKDMGRASHTDAV